MDYLRNAGAVVNRRLLDLERVGQETALSQDALDRLQRPTLEEHVRAPGLRFGDPRVMALLHVLAHFAIVASDFRNADVRASVASLLGWTIEQYSPGRMTYDLRRLRLKV